MATGQHGAYRVATNSAEVASNAFYRKHGFHRAGTQRHNDLILQVYTKALPLAAAAAKDIS